MNIFFLDNNPKIAAEYHVDTHCIKMILETAQLLSTAHRIIDGKEYTDNSTGRKIKRWKLDSELDNILYKSTHINHPSAVWCRETSENYKWLYELFVELCEEYTYRFGKTHKTSVLLPYLSELPRNIKVSKMTTIPQAMPDYCRKLDPIEGYRNYYNLEKQKLIKYTKREIPSWLKGNL